jgi:aryl-alcohol dehydrogenase-like predicted oxidoreductase
MALTGDDEFRFSTLGRTGLRVGRLGIAASYGVPAASVERAFELGVNYFYWGSLRTGAFGEALRNLARRHRSDMVVLVQSYSPVGWFVPASVERALRGLKFDYADLLLLGLWNRMPPARVVDACRRLIERGLVRHLGFSTHRRALLAEAARDEAFRFFHVRYNAVHRGAEKDVFPHVAGPARPGMVSFTATCWGRLLDSGRVPRGELVPSATDCYRFVMTNPAVDVCLSGPGNAAHADAALAALAGGPMTEDELAWMRRVGAAMYRKR